jgi:hypothetical protein
MTDTIRNEADLLALYVVGGDRQISAQDGRDVIKSTLNPYQLIFTEPAEAPTHTPGLVYYDGDTLNFHRAITGVVANLPEETHVPASKNTTGGLIANGTVVYISGALGANPTLGVASNDDDTALKTIAVATHDIADNTDGIATSFGKVRDLNTLAFNAGDELYLGTSGAITKVQPTGTAEVVSIGRCLLSHASNGVILVDIRRVYRRCLEFGMAEARPLQASATFADMKLWSWTDVTVDAQTGDRNQTQVTVENYRDTEQVKSFFRYDRDSTLSFDFQMPHMWAETDVKLHVHLIPMANGSGDAYFTGRTSFSGQGDELPAASSWTSFTKAFTYAPADQYKRNYDSLTTVAAPALPGSSDILSVLVKREGTSGNDTYTTGKDHGTAAANLCVESMDVHYQRLLQGSEEEFSGTASINPTRIVIDKGTISGNAYLRILAKCDAGNPVEYRLWNVTAGATVTGSVVSTSSTTYTWLESSALTLALGENEYRVQGRYVSTPDEPWVAKAMMQIR